MTSIPPERVRAVLRKIARARVLVVGDLMLDQFVWGNVNRISPEAPVPVVEFQSESFMPGGAANVARNITALGATAALLGVTGRDASGRTMRELLTGQRVDCRGLVTSSARPTSIKTRIIAHQQQVVRVDREISGSVDLPAQNKLVAAIDRSIDGADAVIVGDYGKGVVTQPILDTLKRVCRARGIWLSLDPKPIHSLDLRGLSLITPNRKEAYELAGANEAARSRVPLEDASLLAVGAQLMEQLSPAVLLVTLGDQGMLLFQRRLPPVHIPTVAQEVFDVSGAGDTVIASFTLAIAAGASPLEAAVLSNHAAGVVVGKVGTATVSPEEWAQSFKRPA